MRMNIRSMITARERGRRMDEIVCLGWGSLIWCQKALPVIGEWQADGPNLPIEFARESRDGRITLVICEGVPAVTTLWAPLNVPNLDAAKMALAMREGVTAANVRYSIGWWSPAAASEHPGAAVIGQWAAARNLTGVIWTALKPKIGTDNRVPTQVEVVGHLGGLQGLQRDTAEEYVRHAPRQIVTSYRTAIEGTLGWTPLGLV
jgi:hypothetical protein